MAAILVPVLGSWAQALLYHPRCPVLPPSLTRQHLALRLHPLPLGFPSALSAPGPGVCLVLWWRALVSLARHHIFKVAPVRTDLGPGRSSGVAAYSWLFPTRHLLTLFQLPALWTSSSRSDPKQVEHQTQRQISYATWHPYIYIYLYTHTYAYS